MELQAGARRPALPGDRQCRHRAPQRHRTRNPDDAQRSSPRQGHAAAGSAAARDEHGVAGFGALRFRGGRRAAQAGGHAVIDAAAIPADRRGARDRAGAHRAPRRVERRPARLRRPTDRRRAPRHRGGAHGSAARRAHPDPCRRIERDRHLGDTDRSALRRVVRRLGPRRHQRHRRVGGGGRHLDPAAAKSRNTSGVRRRRLRQSRCRADYSDSRRDQPVRVRDARTAGTRVPRADRRGRAGTDSRCAAAYVGRDLVPARHRQHRTGRRARSGRRRRRVCRTAAVDRHFGGGREEHGQEAQPHGRRVA